MTPAYVLEWRSPRMTAPAFWYYRTEADARTVAARMSPGTTAIVRRVYVPDGITLLTEAQS